MQHLTNPAITFTHPLRFMSQLGKNNTSRHLRYLRGEVEKFSLSVKTEQ